MFVCCVLLNSYRDTLQIRLLFSLDVTINNRKKLQFITLLTAICIVSRIENSKK